MAKRGKIPAWYKKNRAAELKKLKKLHSDVIKKRNDDNKRLLKIIKKYK